MCECCSAETIDVGEVVPGIMLVQATKQGQVMRPGDYGLVMSNDPFLVFSGSTFRPDPLFEMTEVENLSSSMLQYADQWCDDAIWFKELLDTKVEIMTSWFIVTQAKACGWKQDLHGYVGLWLFHRIGELIQKGEIQS